MIIKKEEYKGFKIEYWKVVGGFNHYTIHINKVRFKGTRRQEYHYKMIATFNKDLKDARKEAKSYINNLKKIAWSSSGFKKAKYLSK